MWSVTQLPQDSRNNDRACGVQYTTPQDSTGALERCSDTAQATTTLTALPHSWEPPIIQAALASGQITQVTLANTKSIILRYWEGERAKKGATSHVTNKISTVKQKSGDPSFQKQKKRASDGDSSAPSSGKKFKKKKRGTRGGKYVQQSQGFGHVHFTNSASLQPPGAHSIGDYRTKGLIERIAHAITSSFGNGPWTSFNNAMEQANALGLHKGPQTIQTLEQHILGNPSCPAAGVRERTPFPSSSKCQIIEISTTDGEEGDDESDNLSTQTAPPSSGRSTISRHSHSRETAVSLGSDACIASPSYQQPRQLQH